MLPGLGVLVSRSLLRFNGTRYLMHSMVREYGRALLGRGLTEYELHAVRFFFQYTYQHQDDLDLLEAEMANLFAAIEWSEQQQEHRQIAVDLTSLLSPLLERRGYWKERVRRLNRALEIAHLAEDQRAELRLSYLLGHAYQDQGNNEEAESKYQAGLRIAEELHDTSEVAGGHFLLAAIRLHQERVAEAAEHAQMAFRGFEDTQQREMLPLVASLLGTIQLAQKKPKEALSTLERGRMAAQELGDTETLFIILQDIVDAAIAAGDFATARQKLEEGEALAQAMGDERRLGQAMLLLGMFLVENDVDFPAGKDRVQQSMVLLERSESPLPIIMAHEGLAAIGLKEGDALAAVDHLKAAQRLWLQLGNEDEARRTQARVVALLGKESV